MDFGLTELQEMLKTSARDFLKNNCPKNLVKQMAKDIKGYTPELWKMMGEMGWMGLIVPEKYGGAGGSFLDLIVLLEEMGRACLPGPFFSTVVLGGITLIEDGSDEQKEAILPRLAEGKVLMTLAVLEEDPGYNARNIKLKAVPIGADYLLNGRKMFVPDAHVSDYMIVAARTQESINPDYGITLFLIETTTPGIKTNLLHTVTGDKQCEVTFENVKIPVTAIIGRINEGWSILKSVLEKATVARCSEMVGAARQLLEMTVDYVKQRKAFGRPIGSFQAIQHYCANMLTDVDGCSFLVNNAAWRISEGLPASQDIAIAKAITNEAFKKVAGLSFQSHGAIAFTEDSDVPLYYKRAKAWEISFGDTDFHLESLADILGI